MFSLISVKNKRLSGIDVFQFRETWRTLDSSIGPGVGFTHAADLHIADKFLFCLYKHYAVLYKSRGNFPYN